MATMKLAASKPARASCRFGMVPHRVATEYDECLQLTVTETFEDAGGATAETLGEWPPFRLELLVGSGLRDAAGQQCRGETHVERTDDVATPG